MHHQFIINPIASAVKGRVREITEEIKAFFGGIGADNYHIHVTRWVRDGMGYVNRFARTSPEPVRVHSMGGIGTLYEMVNGTIGLPNVQIAAYPMGASNFFLQYFGTDKMHMFRSIRNQVFSDVTPIDVMRGNIGYSIGHTVIGLEAIADRDGSEILERAKHLPVSLCYIYAGIRSIFRVKEIGQRYDIEIDGVDFSGEYVSILVAGPPCYGGGNMIPAPEAHPNDGIMEIYLIKKMSSLKLLSQINNYMSGNHKSMGDNLIHTQGKKITISGERDIMMSLDSECFYDESLTLEILPDAIEFVCPDGIDITKIPRIRTPARGRNSR